MEKKWLKPRKYSSKELRTNLLKRKTSTKGEIVIDPVAGSGTSLLAAYQSGRQSYGFEIKKNYYKEANEKLLKNIQERLY
jgi:DNA modification methylase